MTENQTTTRESFLRRWSRVIQRESGWTKERNVMACTCGPGQQCDPLKPGCWGYEPALSASDGTIKIGTLRISTMRGLNEIAIERDGGEGGWFSLREFHDLVQEFVSERM